MVYFEAEVFAKEEGRPLEGKCQVGRTIFSYFF